MQEHAFVGYEFAAMAHMYGSNSPSFNVLACTAQFITFKGKASHASASPQEGINALNAARLYMDAMDLWRQHLPRNAQFHGIVVRGGDIPTIVPDNIELKFVFRAATLTELDTLCAISDQCLQGAAIATGCTYTMEKLGAPYADLYAPPTAIALIGSLFDAMGEPYVLQKDPQGSTDAGNVDQIIPFFHPLVNAAAPGTTVTLHSKEFQTLMHAESGYLGLRNAARLLANLCLTLATQSETLTAIQKEHRIYRVKTASISGTEKY
jgi:metal-dependent amidase/aminoacylase/carboxypeptidase family protein